MIWESLYVRRGRETGPTTAKRVSIPPLVASPHRAIAKIKITKGKGTIHWQLILKQAHIPSFLFPSEFYVASLYVIIICYSSLHCLLYSFVVSCHYLAQKLVYSRRNFFAICLYLPARRGYGVWQGAMHTLASEIIIN